MDSAQQNEPSQDEILSDILKKFTLSGSPISASSSPSDPHQSGTGDILSAFLSNPELIAKLPSIIATVKPIIEMLGKSASMSGAAAASEPQKSIPAAIASQKTHANDSRTALLCALKPYLGRERQNAIDYVIKLGRLSEVLKTL